MEILIWLYVVDVGERNKKSRSEVRNAFYSQPKPYVKVWQEKVLFRQRIHDALSKL